MSDAGSCCLASQNLHLYAVFDTYIDFRHWRISQYDKQTQDKNKTDLPLLHVNLFAVISEGNVKNCQSLSNNPPGPSWLLKTVIISTFIWKHFILFIPVGFSSKWTWLELHCSISSLSVCLFLFLLHVHTHTCTHTQHFPFCWKQQCAIPPSFTQLGSEKQDKQSSRHCK